MVNANGAAGCGEGYVSGVGVPDEKAAARPFFSGIRQLVDRGHDTVAAIQRAAALVRIGRRPVRANGVGHSTLK